MTVANSDYWQDRYQQGKIGWDLGQPAPPFVRWLNSNQLTGRAIALGCGYGYEALLFAAHGLQVFGVDFALSAIATAQNLAQTKGLSAHFIERDIFDLLPEFAGGFDYVIEHTCFCAIDPAQRPAYVQLVYQLLRPGGEILALFFTHSRPGGPPFGSTVSEIQQHFSPHFEILELEPVDNSVPSRRGEEHWGRLRRSRSVYEGESPT
jgi:methyl halide transferase